MIDFGKWAFNNRKLVYFLIGVMIVGGLLSYIGMSKLEDPVIKVKQAMVVVTYPGASAHEVEMEVADPLEKSIRQMPNINYVQSYSYNDLCLLTVELQQTVPEKEIEQNWDMLRRKVNNASSAFPTGASKPIVKDDFGDVFGMFYALTGDGVSNRRLSDYAEMIKRELQSVDGVSRVDIYGEEGDAIDISLFQDKMANLGVKPTEVLATMDGQNKSVYSGYFDNGTNRIRVTVTDRFKTVEDIGNMIIQGHEDDQLRLRDIAKIEKTIELPVRNSMTYDRQPALGISVAASSTADVTKVGKRVEAKLKSLEADQLPAGVNYHKVFYQPERVNDALNTFIINLIESVLIVLVVLVFAMGFKSALIIGISLVVIVFGSFLMLGSLNGTLQRVSLAAFILAMGMLVDNAIVIIDGILVDLQAGKPRREAMTAIGKKTAMPLLGATFIAILAFLPIFLSPDTAGVYVRDLFIVLAVSLLLSWILALVHVPLMANRYLHPHAPKQGASEDPYSGKWYMILRKLLMFGLRHRIAMVLCAIALLVISGLCYRFLPQGFFPDMEYDQLYMEYKLPEGTNYTQVKKDLDSIQNYLKKRDEITHITASVGGTPSRYNLVRSIATPSLSYGELIIDFKSPKELVKNIDAIQTDLNAMFPSAYIKLKRYNLMYKKYPIEAQFSGPDPAVLHQLADSAAAIMRADEKVALITTDWEPKVPVLTVDYNQPVARRIGLSRSDMGLSLLTAAGGIPASSFYEGIRKNTIYVKTVDKDGRPVENLNETNVFTLIPSISSLTSSENIQKLLSGSVNKQNLVEALMATIPLKSVSSGVKVNWEDPVVIRYNGQRAQRVECSPASGIGTEAARESIAKKIDRIKLPAGYKLEWLGEKRASDDAMTYLFKNFPMAIILMIAILIMLFKDYKMPTIIFCCIPLILIGVIPAVLISGKSFGFVAIVGVLGLIGMMIKTGIVLMDEINLQMESGMEPVEALVRSSQSRLRPVIMASLTTILGMIPLLPDAMFGSLAATIMGGLFAGTVVVLIFIPVLYAMFFHIKLK